MGMPSLSFHMTSPHWADLENYKHTVSRDGWTLCGVGQIESGWDTSVGEGGVVHERYCVGVATIN